MAHTTVTCECGAEVVPGLFHYEGGFLRGRLTEHICPVCGMVMYTTGGVAHPFVRPVLSRLIPALLFLYAYVCAKTGNWANASMAGGMASWLVFCHFPVFARKAARIGVTVILPVFFLWIAIGVPGTGGELWVAMLFLVLAGAILFFSHRHLARLLVRRFLALSGKTIRQNA